MLLLPYTTVGCLFCLFVPLIFKDVYKYSCLLFLAVLFLRLIFFLIILFIPIVHCFDVQNFSRAKVPRSVQLFVLSAWFFLALRFVTLCRGGMLLVLPSFPPSLFFLDILCCFPSFGVLANFVVPDYFTRFAFFLALPCACTSWAVHECMGEPGHPSYPPIFP